MIRFLWTGFYCLLLSSIGISNALAQKPPEPRLLDHAVRIANVKDWDEHWRFSLGHHWLTEHTVLYSRSGSHLSRLMDVKTGKSRQLPQLFISGHLTGIYPSPDGKWIFMRDYHDYDYTLTTFDGSQTYSLSGYSGEIFWLTDSRHFINYDRTDRTGDKRLPDAIGNVNHPNRLMPLPRLSGVSLEDCAVTDAGDHFVTLTWHAPPESGEQCLDSGEWIGIAPLCHVKV